MSEKQIKKELVFDSFLKKITNESIKEANIILHDTPDPDAVGSGAGIQLLLKHNGIDSSIYYRGDISHPQNKTLVNILNLQLIKTNEPPKGVNICVDCSTANSIADEVMLIIDHHKISPKCEFKIINPAYGSCSTIVWKLMQDANITPSEEYTTTYTALLIGIRTDTNDLVSDKMHKDDFIAYQELLEHADKESLQKIMNYPLPRYLYEKRITLHQEGNYYESNGIFVAGIGSIPSTQRDAISILSEEYTRMETVNTAVIFAITDKNYIEVSIRSSNVSLDVNQMCKDIFGDFGGGASYKGAAKIPLNFYSDIDEKLTEDFWKITCKMMFKKVLKESWNVDKEENK